MDELLLLSGNDIPFPEAQLTLHQPKIKEIAYITEDRFWAGCELLRFDKENLTQKDKVNLINTSNFNIIMMMMQGKNIQSHEARLNVLSILALLFPAYKIKLKRKNIQLIDEITGELKEINSNNFENFKKILISIFCLQNKSKQYNPSGDLAQKIADKFKSGQEKRAKLAPNENKKIAILSRYISILAVGERKNINDLMNYTIYQLMDEFTRFDLKNSYDQWERWKIAGAQDLKNPQDWFKDIHEKNITFL